MPRVPRSVLPDGLFHVATRGVAKMAIYLDDNGPPELPRGCSPSPCRHSRWEMPRLLPHDDALSPGARSHPANLSDGMQMLNGDYAQGFNGKYERWGHVFGDRYWSQALPADGERARADLRVRDGEPGPRRSLAETARTGPGRVPSRARLGHRLREHERREHDADHAVHREERRVEAAQVAEAARASARTRAARRPQRRRPSSSQPTSQAEPDRARAGRPSRDAASARPMKRAALAEAHRPRVQALPRGRSHGRRASRRGRTRRPTPQRLRRAPRPPTAACPVIDHPRADRREPVDRAEPEVAQPREPLEVRVDDEHRRPGSATASARSGRAGRRRRG